MRGAGTVQGGLLRQVGQGAHAILAELVGVDVVRRQVFAQLLGVQWGIGGGARGGHRNDDRGATETSQSGTARREHMRRGRTASASLADWSGKSCKAVGGSVGRPIWRSVGLLVGRSGNRSVKRTVNREVTRSAGGGTSDFGFLEPRHQKTQHAFQNWRSFRNSFQTRRNPGAPEAQEGHGEIRLGAPHRQDRCSSR